MEQKYFSLCHTYPIYHLSLLFTILELNLRKPTHCSITQSQNMKSNKNGAADNTGCTKNVENFQFIQHDVNIRNCIKKFNYNKLMLFWSKRAAQTFLLFYIVSYLQKIIRYKIMAHGWMYWILTFLNLMRVLKCDASV